MQVDLSEVWILPLVQRTVESPSSPRLRLTKRSVHRGFISKAYLHESTYMYVH